MMIMMMMMMMMMIIMVMVVVMVVVMIIMMMRVRLGELRDGACYYLQGDSRGVVQHTPSLLHQHTIVTLRSNNSAIVTLFTMFTQQARHASRPPAAAARA